MVYGSEHGHFVQRWCVVVLTYVQHFEQWRVSMNVFSVKKQKKSISLDYSKQNISETEFDSVISCYIVIEINS